MTAMADLYHVLKNEPTGMVLDGNSDGNVYLFDINAGKYQDWSFWITDIGSTIYCAIRQNATGRVLDGNSDGKVYTMEWNHGDYQLWSLEQVDEPAGGLVFRQKATGRLLGWVKGEEVVTLKQEVRGSYWHIFAGSE
jgi:hypothetical protein